MADDYGLDLGPAFREALIGAATFSPLMSLYSGEPAIFTRRPVPENAEYPLAIINAPASIMDQDGLTAQRPVWRGDVLVYGLKGAPGSAEDQTRTVEQASRAIRQLFHRQRLALQVGGFHVIDIVASGPVPAPVDDDKTVGRVVSLTVRLGRI